jgi:uncharacterized membrane protein
MMQVSTAGIRRHRRGSAPRAAQRRLAAAFLPVLAGAACVALPSCRSKSESEVTRAEPLTIAREHESQRGASQPPGRTAAASPAPKGSPSIAPVTQEASARDEDDRPARQDESSGEAKSFRVDGVAKGDVLNIRYKADAESPLAGSIPAGATHVDGLGAPKTVGSATWQRVRYGGVTGWVNARFLKANGGGAAARVAAPPKIETLTPLVCFGAEPDWGLTFGADGAVVCGGNCSPPPSGLRVIKILAGRSGTPDGFDLVDGQGKQWLSAVVAKTDQCSDGMSDDPYPYEFAGNGKLGNLKGCCRVKDKDEH